MIIKSYELNKLNFDQNKLILFYGKNEGLKNDSINKLLKDKENISKYEEKEILENTNIFLENLFSKSLFPSSIRFFLFLNNLKSSLNFQYLSICKKFGGNILSREI